MIGNIPGWGSPREFDENLAARHEDLSKASAALDAHEEYMHRAAGDRRHAGHRNGRNGYVWGMRTGAVIDKLAALEKSGTELDIRVRRRDDTAAAVLAAYRTLASAAGEIREEIAAMDLVYEDNPWPRFFPCLASGGHIHASYRGCRTVQATTVMRWRPDLSGKTAAEAVAELGPALCTVCFPAAPAGWSSKTLDEIERERGAAGRAREKAGRDAAKAAKNLTPGQSFRGIHGMVTTVAGAIGALRDERRMAHYRGIGEPHPNLYAGAARAAQTARSVLLARGHAAGELDVIVSRADKRERRGRADAG